MSHDVFLAAIKQLNERGMTLTELIGATEALKRAEQREQISQLYTLWIAKYPTDPLVNVAYFNHAVLLSDLNELPQAKEALEKCIALAPEFYPAYINYGGVLERLGNPGEAINQWTLLANKLGAVTGQSVQYKLTALKQLGRVMEAHKLLPNSEAVLKQSLEISANQADVLQHYTALRLAQCEWPILTTQEWMDKKTQMKGIGPLSMAIFTDDPVLQLAASWHYCKNFIGYPAADMRAQVKVKPGKRPKKLRVGYISSDLRHHAVGFVMAELFEQHDRERFEIYAYYCGIATEDNIKERIKHGVDQWRDIRTMSDEQAAQQIIDDEVDILIDVNGYTKDARTRIFALRPAPIIVNWLGFPGTMASPYHHYLIADEWIIPPEQEMYYSEKVVRLPCYQPNDRKRMVAEHTPTRAEMGLPEDKFVFCSFNGLQKISRFTFDRWMQILQQVPDSVLWLLDGGDAVNARLREQASQRGVDGSRIVFAGKMGNAEHLARYPLADLFLDTLPYGAHVTASDALWMGVPILTLVGRGFAARVCSGLVQAAGLPELVCHTPDEFVARAVALANNPAEVAALKRKLADNRETCTLFDTPKLLRHLEALYDGMWEDFSAGKLPTPSLNGLDTYLEIGSEIDHDAVEMLSVPGYPDNYRELLAARHRYHPLPTDTRLWTAKDIARFTDGTSSAQVHELRPSLFKRKR